MQHNQQKIAGEKPAPSPPLPPIPPPPPTPPVQLAPSMQQHTPAGSVSQQGANNLLNLANIDNAFFNQQQQQLRAEQLLQSQNQQAAASQLAPRPSGSPSSNTSSECLNFSDRQSCASTRTQPTTTNTTTTNSSSSCSSGSANANLASSSAGGGFVAAAAAGRPAPVARQQQPLAQQTTQPDLNEEQLPSSDTTDDIKSLSSQFNILSASTPLEQLSQSGPQQAGNLNAPFVQGHGHYFTKKTFHKPTYCHHCTEMLWGLIGQGYICEVCNFVVHERCMKMVHSCCSTVASSVIKNPMPHCWIEAHPKKKFCHVCRKRIEDGILAIRCSVCEYCAHLECQEFSISDCRECASFVPDQSVHEVAQHHHWREGNLPSNSRCHVCKKSCLSTECLSGMRCEWCQITLHTVCLKQAGRDCNLGQLQSIMLPPSCVSIPRTDVPMETIIGVQSRFMGGQVWSPLMSGMTSSGSVGVQSMLMSNQAIQMAKRDNLSPRSTSEDFCTIGLPSPAGAGSSSSFYLQQQQQQQQQQAIQQQQEDSITRDKDEELLRVYDGNCSLKKRSFRLISVQRTISRDNLIAACLRGFYIHDDVNHYALIDITETSTGGSERERELDDLFPLTCLASTGSLVSSYGGSSQSGAQQPASVKRNQERSYSSQSSSNKPPAILLRYRPPDSFMGSIKVYPGRLNVNSELTYCDVLVTSDTSVNEVMRQALDMFRLRTNELSRYRLVEVSLDKGSSVHERTMDNEECPWEIIKNVARESVRQKEMTRFYLQQQDEVYCSSVAIYVGNLPANLSQKQYEFMLLEQLGKPYRFKQINPIYYEHGSCIITYDNADIAVKAFYRLRESTIRYGDETRNLVVLLLPNIMPEMIPDDVRPLLVFVNVKSGGCQGLDLITSFRRLLNPYQVYDLENGGPLPGLYVFRKIRDYKILVSGGDGSVGWVLQCLDNVGQDSECQSPPCAIIPLGTGNDLARVLRWGSGFTGAEDPISFLKDIIEAEEVILDRWTVVFHSDEANKQDFQNIPASLASTTPSGAEDNAAIFVMNNYLGIGLDADLCLGFHNAREENPDKFNSRLHNKGVYVKQAFRKIVNRSSWNNLSKTVKLEVDGKPVPLPHVEGIIILNILSWGSGANPWGIEQDDRFAKPTHYDGMLEVVGVTGIVHMGQIQSGLSRALRIAQGCRIKLRLNTEVPIQVDGEPWIQSACEVNIIRSALKATMLRKSKMKRRNTEPSINRDVNQPSSGEQIKVSGI